MASGSQNMTTYNARTVTGSNSAASPAGALLLSGEGRADNATGDTWLFLDSAGGTDTPWGIKHDQANNKIQIFGAGTNSVWAEMNTGNTYIGGSLNTGSILTVRAQDDVHEGGEIVLSPATDSFSIVHVDAYDSMFRLHDGTNERFKVDISTGNATINGNLGIGTDYAVSGGSYKLYVNGSSYFNDIIHLPKGLLTGNRVSGTGSGIEINNDGGIEIYHTSTPFIDFHYNNDTADYTYRLIANHGDGISLISKSGVNCWFYVGNGTNTAGIYWPTFDGGIYMNDSKWLRTYGSKPLLVDIGTNNTYGIGTHRLALGLAGSSHTSIMLKGGDVMYGFAVNNDGNWYFGKRTSKSFESASGDAYIYYGNATSILPNVTNTVTLGDSDHKWTHLYCQGRVYLDEWIQFSGYSGLYAPNANGAHWYPNNVSSYGTWTMLGSRNGYSGIQLGGSTNYMTVMDNSNDKGFFQEGKRWVFWYNRDADVCCIMNCNNSGWKINLAENTYCYGAFYSGDIRGNCVRLVDNWIGFYAGANASSSRNGFIQCDGSTMYFRKETGSATNKFDFNGQIYCSGGINTGMVRARGGFSVLSDASSGNCAVWFYNQANSVAYWKITVSSNTNQLVFARYDSGTLTNKFWINNNGTTGQSSSRFIKHNIQNITLDTGFIIDKMQPVSYIVNGDVTNKTTYGFIYEDLIQILPNVCDNNNGNVGITYTALIPILTKEIQNLRRRIASIETELKQYRFNI